MTHARSLAAVILVGTACLLAWWVRSALVGGGGAAGRGSATAEGWPREVVSADGAVVRIEAPPARAVPATARAAEILTDIAPPERIAGLPEQVFEYGTLGTRERGFAGHPRFRSYVAESVLELRPDLVVADPWQSADTHARLRESGVAVLVLPEVSTWIQAREALALAGQALGCETKAAALTLECEERVRVLLLRARAAPPERALCYSNFGAEGFTAGAGTSMDEILRLAGLENAAAAAGRRGHVGITFEELILIDPALIVVSRPLNVPIGQAGDRGGASEELLYREKSLQGLRAVRERSVLTIPAGLFACASHRLVEGAEVLAAEVDAWRARRLALPPLPSKGPRGEPRDLK